MTTSPSYNEVAKTLEKNHSEFNPAQVHGLLCGLICVLPLHVDYDWKKHVLGINSKPAAVEVLERLYEATYQELHEFSFEFSLLLPDDKLDINSRTESLGLWCQGFLIGLQQSDEMTWQSISEEMENALTDITEIAKVDFGDIMKNEEDETAYFELVEYVRLAALMIFQEIHANYRETVSEKNNLH